MGISQNFLCEILRMLLIFFIAFPSAVAFFHHPESMIQTNFFKDQKYCPRCHDYVRFLQSVDASFCVACGAKVRLFSAADKRAFLTSLKNGKKNARTGKKRVS